MTTAKIIDAPARIVIAFSMHLLTALKWRNREPFIRYCSRSMSQFRVSSVVVLFRCHINPFSKCMKGLDGRDPWADQYRRTRIVYSSTRHSPSQHAGPAAGRTRMTFAAPGVPKGRPAVTTIKSSGSLTRPFLRAALQVLRRTISRSSVPFSTTAKEKERDNPVSSRHVRNDETKA